MDRSELADFLRRRREQAAPPGRRAGRRAAPAYPRPAPRGGRPVGRHVGRLLRAPRAATQPATVDPAARRAARALRLTEDERDHLFVLAGHRPPAGRYAGQHVRPGLLALLDQLEHAPAQILTDLGDLLAQNTLARLLFGGMCSVAEGERNVVWRWFTDPTVRQAYPADEHEYYGRLHVADLRGAVARHRKDPAANQLVERLRTHSVEFCQLWDRHEVAVRRQSRMHVLHPMLGPLELDCETLLTPAEDQRFLVFTAPPGSDTAERLEMLRVVAPDRFEIFGAR